MKVQDELSMNLFPDSTIFESRFRRLYDMLYSTFFISKQFRLWHAKFKGDTEYCKSQWEILRSQDWDTPQGEAWIRSALRATDKKLIYGAVVLAGQIGPHKFVSELIDASYSLGVGAYLAARLLGQM